MSAPVVLMYNLDNATGSRIRLLCLKLKIRAATVPPECFGMPLSELCRTALPHPGSGEAAPFTDEMLLMANLSQAQFNQFLNGFRAERIPGVALKAILTPANSAWDSVQLHDALAEEHAKFTAMKQKK